MYDRVIQDLKVIGMCRENDRVSSDGGMVCLVTPGIGGSIWRWSRGDCRSKSVSLIQNTFNSSIDIMASLAQSATSRTCVGHEAKRDALLRDIKRLATHVREAMCGLRALRVTYSGDLSTIAKIDVILERTATNLERHGFGGGVAQAEGGRSGMPVVLCLEDI